MNRIITTLLALLLIQFMVVKKVYGEEGEVKDCFEKLNRATFALNMGLENLSTIIFLCPIIINNQIINNSSKFV